MYKALIFLSESARIAWYCIAITLRTLVRVAALTSFILAAAAALVVAFPLVVVAELAYGKDKR